MREELIKRKKQALKVLSRKEYYKYINLVGKVYVADYDLKVFMARKFSNHYISLFDLMREENGGKMLRDHDAMVRRRNEEPITISNNALPFIKQLILDGNIKRVLLLDDLVLHGRTLDRYYDKIYRWMLKAGIENPQIDVWSYAQSEDRLICSDSMKKLNSVDTFAQNEWRRTSNQIVDLFYLLGQPYTSYVPNYRLSIDDDVSKKLNENLFSENIIFKETQYTDLTEECVKTYTFNESFDSELIIAFSVRLYFFPGQREFVVVPMVTMKPLNSEELFNIYNYCEEWIKDEKLISSVNNIYNDIKELEIKKNTEIDGIDAVYRLVVYILSALYGWIFMREKFKIDPDMVRYDIREEQYNFRYDVLNYENVSIGRVKSTLEKINKLKIVFDNNKFDEDCKKEDTIGSLIKSYDSIDNSLSKKSGRVDSHKDEIFDYCKYRMERFLNINGDKDEDSYEKSKTEQQKNIIPRYKGVPVYWLLEKGSEGVKKESQFNSILYVTDLGKGSVVPMYWNGKIMPFLHAGEQNYQFYEDYYFSYIYGLYILTKSGNNLKKISIQKAKEDFTNIICAYWNDNNIIYDKSELIKIQKLNIINEYSSIISSKIKKYADSEDCKYALQVVNEILYGDK